MENTNSSTVTSQRPSEQVSVHQRGLGSLKGAEQAFTVSSCGGQGLAGSLDIHSVEDSRLASPRTYRAYLATVIQAFSDSEIRCQPQRSLRCLPISPGAQCYPVASSWTLLVGAEHMGHILWQRNYLFHI